MVESVGVPATDGCKCRNIRKEQVLLTRELRNAPVLFNVFIDAQET
jgi:hypothetical protein